MSFENFAALDLSSVLSAGRSATLLLLNHRVVAVDIFLQIGSIALQSLLAMQLYHKNLRKYTATLHSFIIVHQIFFENNFHFQNFTKKNRQNLLALSRENTKYNRISFDRFGGPDRTRFDYTNFECKSTSFCTVEILKKYSRLKYILKKLFLKNESHARMSLLIRAILVRFVCIKNKQKEANLTHECACALGRFTEICQNLNYMQ